HRSSSLHARPSLGQRRQRSVAERAWTAWLSVSAMGWPVTSNTTPATLLSVHAQVESLVPCKAGALTGLHSKDVPLTLVSVACARSTFHPLAPAPVTRP